jgi:hypothetical protein
MEKAVRIDPEFRNLVPEITKDEKCILEKSILEEGCRDPLVTWDDILLDGHNRYEICQRHKIDFKMLRKDLDSREQAKLWIINNQLGRRNLTPQQISYLRGLQYLLSDKEQERDPQGHFVATEKPAEKIANQHGISKKTIERDAKFAQALENLPPDEKKEVLAGKSMKTKKEIVNPTPPAKPKQDLPSEQRENLYYLKRYWKRSDHSIREAFIKFIQDGFPEFRMSNMEKIYLEGYRELFFQLIEPHLKPGSSNKLINGIMAMAAGGKE